MSENEKPRFTAGAFLDATQVEYHMTESHSNPLPTENAATSLFAQHASRLLQLGYSPLPIRPETKRPFLEEWSRLCETALTTEEVSHLSLLAGAGLGLACGYNRVMGIDIDTGDPEILTAINTVVPGSPLTKRGAKGETRFFRVEDEPVSRSFTSRREYGSERLIDILGMGRQAVIPPSVHPETGRAYEWTGGITICEVPAHELSALEPDFVDRLEEALKPWLPERASFEDEDQGYSLRPKGPIGGAERKRYEGWFRRAFEDRLKELATVGQGSRNQELYRLVCYLGKFVHYGIIPEREFFTRLEEACRANGLVQQDGFPSVRATVKSGLRASRNDLLPLLEGMQGSTSTAKAVTPARVEDPWPELRPLNEVIERQPYPLDAHPPLILNAVKEVQAFVQAPVEMVATSAISAMSAAFQGHRDVRRSSKLKGPISLWLQTVAESGERKTSLDKYFSELDPQV